MKISFLKSSSFVLLALLPSLLFAQDWIKVFNSSAPYSEKKAAFEEYFSTHPAIKGSGYKQFKRWEWMSLQRLDESGNKPSFAQMWPEIKKVQAAGAEKVLGGAWTHLGPILVPTNINGSNGAGIGRVNVIAFHPTDTNIIWAGAPSGGLWKSTDGGVNWVSNTDQFVNLGVSDIQIQSSDPNIMYIATGDRNAGDTPSYGVLKSIDGGQTWNPTGLSFALSAGNLVSALLLDQSDPNIIYAGTNTGIFKSTDAGANWTNVNNFHTDDMNFKADDFNTIYASGYPNAGGAWRVIKSSDNGQTWANASTGIPTSNVGRIRIALTPANPSLVYALASADDQTFRGLYKSTDNGTSWTEMSNSPNILGYESDGSDDKGQSWYDLDLSVSETDENYIVAVGINVWASANGGAGWVCRGHWTGDASVGYIHADQHFSGFQPGTGKLWAGCDGGVFLLYPGSNNWYVRSNGMGITQFYRLGTSTLTQNYILSGAQDNGTKKYITGGWQRIQGGDGMEAMVDRANDDVVYCTTQNGSFYKSIAGGNGGFTNLTPQLNGQAITGSWVTPFVMDYESPSLIYGGYQNVWVSGNGGINWNTVSPDLTTSGDGNLLNMALSRNGTPSIVAARYKAIFRSTDYGGSWPNITTNLPIPSGVGISYVAIDDYDAEIMYVTLSGYSAGNKVFKTVNGGASWTNISGSLPNIAVNCIETEMSNERGLYIGTEFGVWFRDNTMNDWDIFGTGLPNVSVSELEITEKFGKLEAATFGRGIWEADIINTIYDNTGLSQNKKPLTEGLQIFPNPNSGVFTVKLTENGIIKNLTIRNLDGKTVFNLNSFSQENLAQVNISDLSAGIYILEVQSDKKQYLQRFVHKGKE